MNIQERIDKILASARTRMEEEITALLNGRFSFSGPLQHPAGKEELAGQLAGKQTLVRLEFSGDLNGEAFLFVSQRDAIRLGGTLIMLPPAELDSAVEGEELSSETGEAFGEISNIFAGALSTVFAEQFSSPLRFVRTATETVEAVRNDAGSLPCPARQYYQMSATMALGDRQLGDLHFLLPADPFGLAGETAGQGADTAGSAGGWGEPEAASPTPAAPPKATAGDAQKQRKLVDRLLEICREKSAEEVASLLGTKFVLTAQGTTLLNKEDLLDQLGGPQVLAHLTVRGETAGEGYLLAGVKDAVRLGGTLIMLPPGDLEESVTADRFEGEVEDAFGEIANIIAGACTRVFEEKFTRPLGFVRTELEKILPTGIDPDSDEVLLNQLAIVAGYGMRLDGTDLGVLRLVLPAPSLGLHQQVEVKEAPVSPQEERPRRLQPLAGEGPEVLVVSEVEGEGQSIAEVLQRSGFAVRILHSRDNFHDYLPGEVRGVFLVMREVSEQGFGVAIKLRGACGGNIPLIICGPAWTRSKVLQAVRYGANDILITPAGADDIEEQISRNINSRKAA